MLHELKTQADSLCCCLNSDCFCKWELNLTGSNKLAQQPHCDTQNQLISSSSAKGCTLFKAGLWAFHFVSCNCLYQWDIKKKASRQNTLRVKSQDSPALEEWNPLWFAVRTQETKHLRRLPDPPGYGSTFKIKTALILSCIYSVSILYLSESVNWRILICHVC